ncbi:type II toxin-antitoxin system RelE family toxin [Wolbachia endosymbiont of Folsomia candida]|uniref:type II toxin-antitoxin system RelE family toxin n=1 Tax=Wolbachia endosymbiont of Folsomia candida TaxID=169402 RepID=UPI000B2CA528|nr:type II toxin-antitoxin system RelE/ParE family toxin [Wolbachia endosymbiont of Folsomia candida]APR98997.1 type II toxin-antitoxin system RelE/ParE family toxin [Wolbachia endosymbiont of Folsomia candida]
MEIKLYQIDFLDGVAERDLLTLPVTIERRVKKAIWGRLTVSPDKLGKQLSHEFKGYFSLRVGDYRVIYRIEVLERKVLITAIGHRRDIYKRVPE